MTSRDFQRVAIVSRGHAAMRFIHSVRELNREHGTDIRTVALATDPDRGAMFAREADEVVWLGAPVFVDPRDQRTKSRYVDQRRIREALASARADAAWLGWSFVPEHLESAETCRAAGVLLVGPELSAMRRLRDKIGTKRLASELGIPVVGWSGGPVMTLAEARRCAEERGFPVLIKSALGGAGRTMAAASSMEELTSAFVRVRSEAERALGSPECYLEDRIAGARLVSVQILADSHGTVWDVGVRDGSVQRAYSKFLDEAPAPDLPADVERKIREWAVTLMRTARYEGVGGVEFLVDASRGEAWLLEVNPRLETAHDVIEATTGIDLVKQEIFVARGGKLEGAKPTQAGHAFEVRLRAEDPTTGFSPAPGVIELFRPPMGPGIRVEASVADGDEVPAGLSMLIAKLVASGRTRSEALTRLARGLRDTTLLVRGGTTNKSFLLSLASRDEVREGPVDVDWLDQVAARGGLAASEHAGAALVVAALELHDELLAEEQAAFLASAARGRPTVRPEVGRTVEVVYRGRGHRVAVARRGNDRYRVELPAGSALVGYERRGAFERRVTGESGRSLRAVVASDELSVLVEVEGIAHRVYRQGSGLVRAPSPGVVQSIAVSAGDRVERGDELVVIEAMKMEIRIAAPFGGSVRQVLAVRNVPVPLGAGLVMLESAPLPADSPGEPGVQDEPSLAPRPPASAREAWRRDVDALRELLLGYDVDAGEARRLVAGMSARIAELGPADPGVLRADRELLGVFVDLSALFRRRSSGDEDDDPDLGAEEYLTTFLRARDPGTRALPARFLSELMVALSHYGVTILEPSRALDEALFRLFRGRQRHDLQLLPVVEILERWLASGGAHLREAESSTLLDSMARVMRGRSDVVADLALEVSYRLFARPLFEEARGRSLSVAAEHLAALVREPDPPAREEHMRALVASPYPLFEFLAERLGSSSPIERELALSVLSARFYRARSIKGTEPRARGDLRFVEAELRDGLRLLASCTPYEELEGAARELAAYIAAAPEGAAFVVDLYVRPGARAAWLGDDAALEAELRGALGRAALAARAERVTVVLSGAGPTRDFTFAQGAEGPVEEALYRGLHPMMAERLRLDRLREFTVERLPAPPDVYLFRGVARKNPKDERLFAFAEVRDLTPTRAPDRSLVQLPELERLFQEALASIRSAQAQRPAAQRLHWNRVELFVWPVIELGPADLRSLAGRLARSTAGAGLENVLVHGAFRDAPGAEPALRVLEMTKPAGMSLSLAECPEADAPIAPLSEYEQKVVRARQRGLTYPHEVIRMLTPPRREGAAFPPGDFVEHDLVGDELAPVDRAPGGNAANMIVGVLRNFTATHPEGMARVVLLGDPSKSLGSLAEPECRRILGALSLARRMRVPVEWFALSSGAKIAMDSGTENMDWIAAVLRGLIEFTQDGGEINVVVMGINVGGQPYWNAEATMLMHTRGILVMMPQSAMVLTGKRALDYSGGVSAEDDYGIGGYDRVMGVNGQAQYFARDVADACKILLAHYEHAYVAPGERFPRRADTKDPRGRDVCSSPHGDGFDTVGDIFSSEKNLERKKPFHIRRVMAAAIDQDHPQLERWRDMRDAENVVVWDAHLGGYPACVLGVESEPIARRGPIPADGPEQWTGGTLFPQASKKMARAINAASGNRPVVILANLSGFDGSPESMRGCQLEFGAEIGRAVVNFRGPIVFCVVSRFHGGAYVVFSRTLNENIEVTALEGTYASVIGGAPAAGVVFAGEVDARAKADPRVRAQADELAHAPEGAKRKIRARMDDLLRLVRAENVGKLASEFDREHSVHRALRVGSLHHIIPPSSLRPYLIEAMERGMDRELTRVGYPARR